MNLQPLIDFYQQLTPEHIERMPELYSADAYFKDPFNEVRGVTAIQAIFRHMFQQLDSPRFVVTDRLTDAHGALLVWEFSFRVHRWRGKAIQTIRGASHLRFDGDGKVNYHRDYWDAAEELYATLPLIGAIMRRLRRAFSTPAIHS